jgi:quercetin dioxygenase-like cupin family protein
MTDRGWQTSPIDDIPRSGRTWIPVRKHFDVKAFGVNAWTADEEGGQIVSEHKEDTGHEELYFVSTGHATFTVGGEEVDAPVGTFVFVDDPETLRSAVAKEAGTTVLAVGAKPGEAYEVRPWEASAEMWPLYEAGDYEGAAAILRAGLEREEDAGIIYNLACIEALMGHKDEAIDLLGRIVGEPRFHELASSDSDLDSLRDDPRFATLLETS